jgi:hypothetical protein
MNDEYDIGFEDDNELDDSKSVIMKDPVASRKLLAKR